MEEMKVDLKTLSLETNIKYWSLLGWRSKDRTPGAEDIVTISRFLNVSTDSLLLGSEAKSVTSKEAIQVDDDPELQALVRAIMRDRELLRIISAVVKSSEKSIGMA